MFLAFPLGNWRISVDNTSTTSIRFSWQNLQTLVGQQTSYYFIFVKDSYGRGLKEYIVPGNTISHVVSGLTAYREYRLSVAGVNYSGNAYNSTEITAWTDEGGTCNISKDVVFVCLFFSFFFLFISRVSQVYAKRLLVSEEWPCNRNSQPPSLVNRELKQQRRGRLRKRQLKCVFALLKTLSRLFHFVLFIRCWRIFLELNSKGLYLSSGKEKEGRCLVFTSSTKKVKLGSLTS